MAQITARFRVISVTSDRTKEDIVLRATKQSDVANTENPVLWDDNDSPKCEINLRIKRDQAVSVFKRGKDVLVNINGPA